MYKVLISKTATKDLKSAFEYIKYTLKNILYCIIKSHLLNFECKKVPKGAITINVVTTDNLAYNQL